MLLAFLNLIYIFRNCKALQREVQVGPRQKGDPFRDMAHHAHKSWPQDLHLPWSKGSTVSYKAPFLPKPSFRQNQCHLVRVLEQWNIVRNLIEFKVWRGRHKGMLLGLQYSKDTQISSENSWIISMHLHQLTISQMTQNFKTNISTIYSLVCAICMVEWLILTRHS